MRLQREQRLRSSRDFQFVQSAAIRKDCGFFMILARRNNDPSDSNRRFGIIASKRVGNAVARNYAKRLLRELCRNHQDRFPEGFDFIFIARKSIAKARFETLERRCLGAAFSLISELK